jgi:putative membrane protein
MNPGNNPLLSSIIFAVVGILVFVIAFWILNRATPYHLWKEINEKNNVALAILVGSGMIGLALIISAAIHG